MVNFKNLTVACLRWKRGLIMGEAACISKLFLLKERVLSDPFSLKNRARSCAAIAQAYNAAGVFYAKRWDVGYEFMRRSMLPCASMHNGI